MPSWETHKIVGNLVLNYCNPEIDKIVDFTLGHDSSRYDVKKLIEAIDTIMKRYDEIGVKYFILHHYLDRLVDILISEITFAYELYKFSQKKIDEACIEIAKNSLSRLIRDPKNILSLFICDLETLKTILRYMYDGKSRRRKRKYFTKLLDDTYINLQNYEKFNFVRSKILEVLREVELHFNEILFLVLTDESFGNPRTLSRITWCIKMKMFSFMYHAAKRARDSNISFEDLPEFISAIIEYLNSEINI